MLRSSPHERAVQRGLLLEVCRRGVHFAAQTGWASTRSTKTKVYENKGFYKFSER